MEDWKTKTLSSKLAFFVFSFCFARLSLLLATKSKERKESDTCHVISYLAPPW